MIIARPGEGHHWQYMGEEEPHPTPEFSRPLQEVPAGAREKANAREVTRRLREVAREEAKKPGPGSRCPQWLAAIMRSGGR